MELVKVEVELPKECYELAKGLGEFAVAVKSALANGWQMGEDLPVVITAAMASLVPSVMGVEKIPAEAQGDPLGAGQALLVGLAPVFKKPAA